MGTKAEPAAKPPAQGAKPADADVQPGSAAEVTQRCNEAMAEVKDSLSAGNGDDATSKYSRCLKVLGLDAILEDVEFGVSVLASLTMEPLSLDDSLPAKTHSVKMVSPQKVVPGGSHGSSHGSALPLTSPFLSPELGPSKSVLEWAEAEASLVSRVTFLASMRDLPDFQVHLQSERALTALFSLVRLGSPRLQRLALLLLESALPSAKPGVANTAVLRATMSLPTVFGVPGAAGSAVVAALLQIVADACVTGSGSVTSKPALSVVCPLGYGSGHVLLSLRAWTLCVIRALMASPEWTGIVWGVLDAGLASVLPFVHDASSPQALPCYGVAQAAFCVLGGFTESLRVGARVVTSQVMRDNGTTGHAALTAQWAGTIVRFSRGSALAQVVYDPTAPLADVEPSELVPLDPLALPAQCSALTPTAINALLAVLSVVLPELPGPIEELAPAGDADEAGADSKTAGKSFVPLKSDAPPVTESPAVTDGSLVSIDDLSQSVDAYQLWLSALQKVRSWFLLEAVTLADIRLF